MFFDKPWSQVTDEDISVLAQKLEQEMGGWIFHNKVNFDIPTPSLKLNLNEPEIMNAKDLSNNLQLQPQ
jgi:hypothetical protein